MVLMHSAQPGEGEVFPLGHSAHFFTNQGHADWFVIYRMFRGDKEMEEKEKEKKEEELSWGKIEVLRGRIESFLFRNKGRMFSIDEIFEGLYGHWTKEQIQKALGELSTRTHCIECVMPLLDIREVEGVKKYGIPDSYDWNKYYKDYRFFQKILRERSAEIEERGKI